MQNNFPFSIAINQLITHAHSNFCLDQLTMVGMFEQARQAFFQANQLTDSSSAKELILLSSTYSLIKNLPTNNNLLIKLGISDYTTYKFKIIYQVSDAANHEIMHGGEVFAFFDLPQKNLISLPPEFLIFCAASQVSGNNLPARELLVN